MNISVIFSSLNAARSIAEFLGLIKSDLVVLKQNQFETAIRLLEDAVHSEKERTTLLRGARGHFQQAAGLEQHLRLAYTFLGLAMCHHHLGDLENSKRALQKLTEVEPPGILENVKATVRDEITLPGGLGLKSLAILFGGEKARQVLEPNQMRLEQEQKTLLHLQNAIRQELLIG